MIVIGIFLLFIALFFLLKEVQGNKKLKQIKRYKDFIKSDIGTGKVINESTILAAGATGISILDVYHTMDQHEQFLSILEQRYPNELGNATPMEWLQKVYTLHESGDASMNAYVSGYAGEAAEMEAMQHFNSQGLQAEQFASKTHPDNDIRVFQEDGTYIDYSVKSYSNVSDFQNVVLNHPNSTHYVINDELYEKLQQNGMLQDYANNGITIVNGGYSTIALRNDASNAMEDILDAGDVAGNIPFVGLGVLAFKGVNNVRQFSKGHQSTSETGMNIANDVVRLGAATGGGFALGQVGAAIGSVVTPGIGTVIGGGVGAIVGAIAAGSFVQSLKEKWKWGNIIKAQTEVGRAYYSYYHHSIPNRISNNLFHSSENNQKLWNEQILLQKYKNQLNPYKKENVTIAAVLSQTYCDELSMLLKKIKFASKKTKKELEKLCREAANKYSQINTKTSFTDAKYRYMGELILGNQDILLDDRMQSQFADVIRKYEAQKKSNPNYPIRFQLDPKDILNGLALKSINKKKVFNLYYKKILLRRLFIFIALVISIGLLTNGWLF